MKPYYETQLEQAFHFTEQDLRDNRDGRLSPEQATRLRSAALRLLAGVGGVVALVTILGLLSARAAPGEITLALLCIVLPSIGLTFAFTLGTTEAAIGPRVVSKVSGLAHLAYGMSDFDPPLDFDQRTNARRFMLRPQSAYRVVIGDREFRLSKDEYEALAPGYYLVYFVPTINKIVGVQRIDPDEKAGVVSAPKEIIITPHTATDEGGEDVRA